ncbi:hypothetical protein R1flu_014474 [Riccia fluitans]|uniref:Uncharacterized protein n=1 Tax=Riccia fluitans TaxID=41844 RepID=A0ABD1YGG0_9MARC
MVTLTRKQAGNSWQIETSAVAKGLELLWNKGIIVAEDSKKAVHQGEIKAASTMEELALSPEGMATVPEVADWW